MRVTEKDTEDIYTYLKSLGNDMVYLLLWHAKTRYESEKVKKEQREYLKKYPNVCKHCGGAGGHAVHGNFYEPDSYDLCSCYEDLICPRCGKEKAFDELENGDVTKICKFCGWDEDKPDICPEDYTGEYGYEIEYAIREVLNGARLENIL